MGPDLARTQANAAWRSHFCRPRFDRYLTSIHWQSRPPTSNHPLKITALWPSAINTSFDIYHSHFDNLQYSLGYLTNKPIVFTQHWWPYEQTVTAASRYPNTNIWAVLDTFPCTILIHKIIYSHARSYLSWYWPITIMSQPKSGASIICRQDIPEKPCIMHRLRKSLV